jgi:Amt family ammonium transporter
MLKNLLDACGAAVAYFCCGYAFAFGDDPDLRSAASTDDRGTTLIGWGNFFARGDIDFPFTFSVYFRSSLRDSSIQWLSIVSGLAKTS